ncbi:MAG: TonB-dependent receptor [Marinifilaceae bacterium]
MKAILKKLIGSYILVSIALLTYAESNATLSGIVQTTKDEAVEYALVYLKGTNYSSTTDEKGFYRLQAPAGQYTLVIFSAGYETVEKAIHLVNEHATEYNPLIVPLSVQLDEVTIASKSISTLQRSAFNAIKINTKHLRNSTKNLSDALVKAPGVKLRESGGVGSDMQLMIDGFSGKHVKVFIDGVPQEGVGSSFSLNNIPVSFAESIEVYKGVVPVGFGTDALGGVVNIVTNKKPRGWFLDASYSYGSFNTHKSSVNFGHTLNNGLTYEINAFQNYSDNNYHIYAPVKDFETGRLDTDKKERVKRFNDTYHNEAVIGKVGLVNKSWADRVLLGFSYTNVYKELQTGVRQNTVYGDKHSHGYSYMPSLEYSKRDMLVRGLNLVFTANYNKDKITHVDTSAYEYNWRGDKQLMNSRGEQSYQHTRVNNTNWNGTVTLDYRIGNVHAFTFNNVLHSFNRSNTSLLANEEVTDPIMKETRKNVAGLSYRLMPSEHWNLSVFAKHYNQFVAGPMATDNTNSDYIRTSRSVSSIGYGAASTYFILPELQVKLSYEKAYRLPTIEEMFGNEDIEMGDIGIRPESSNNLNFNVSFSKTIGNNDIYVEGGLLYRNTDDYIQRNIIDLSGGKRAASYINYGKVLTQGYNVALRYSFSNWLNIGGNYTQMNVRDNQKTAIGSSAENIAYRERMPNLPYHFADMDLTFTKHNFLKRGNTLIFTYDNQYVHQFSYYSSIIGSNKGEYVVPNQFSHNLTMSYSIRNGRYNVAIECRNLLDEKLYDNFSLQKAGRAFYGKFRIYLGQ